MIDWASFIDMGVINDALECFFLIPAGILLAVIIWLVAYLIRWVFTLLKG